MTRRLARFFAVAATLLMLLMVADSNVVRIASANAAPPPDVNDDGGNDTAPAPPITQDPPIEQPQRDVEPGTVTQGWDNGSLGPTPLREEFPINFQANETVVAYRASYGMFEIPRAYPCFISVNDGDLRSGFIGLYSGAVLEPLTGAIDEATPGRLVLHCEMYTGAKLAGTLKLTMNFANETNKIAVEFSPGDGIDGALVQIVWLSFTTYSVVLTMDLSDIQTYFSDLSVYLGTVKVGDTTMYRAGLGDYNITLKSSKSGDTEQVVLDATDGASEWSGGYAGEFTLGNLSGNAVATLFKQGSLSIDPSIVASGQYQIASGDVEQRKVFFDGTRYWAFWKGKSGTTPPDTIKFASSPDGRTWAVSSSNLPSMPNTLPLGFDVASYGGFVDIVWTDGAKTSLNIIAGRIVNDAIQWESSSRQLLTTTYIMQSVSATFTPQGTLVLAYVQGGYLLWFARCKADGGPTCSTGVDSPSQVYSGIPKSLSAMVVPFNSDSGEVAVVIASTYAGDTSYSFLALLATGVTPSGCTAGPVAIETSAGDGPADGSFTAAASGLYVSIFYRLHSGSNYQIKAYNAKVDCSGSIDSTTSPIFGPAGTPEQYLTAGTEQDGKSVYLFFSWGSANRDIYYARIIPEFSKTVSGPPGWLSAYQNPYYLTAAATSSRFVPLMFTTDNSNVCSPSSKVYCLYFVNWPLPFDGESSPNSPWSQTLGTPLITEGGAVVNPSLGLLATGQFLVTLPSRGLGTSISILYREPALFYSSGGYDTTYRYYSAPTEYGRILPTGAATPQVMSLDLPWIDVGGVQMLHLETGQAFLIRWGETSGTVRWFNNTNGAAFSVKFDSTAGLYTLTMASGTARLFDFTGKITETQMDGTGQNKVTYSYANSHLDRVSDTTGHSIQILYSGDVIDKLVDGIDGRLISDFDTSAGVPAGCGGGTLSDSGTLTVVDPVGRTTSFLLCHFKLTSSDASSGGKVVYTYAIYGLDQIWQGSDVYTLPVTKIEVYNESGPGIRARSTTISYLAANGIVLKATVRSYDRYGVFQGQREYVYDAPLKRSTIASRDATNYALYYTMERVSGTQTVTDYTGNGNVGMLSNTADDAGKWGKAILFNGASSYLEAVDSPTLSNTKAVTVSLWFRHQYTSFPLNDFKGLFFKGANTGWGQRNYEGSLQTNGRISISWLNAATSDSLLSNAYVTDNRWHHLVAVFDWYHDSFKLYLDGSLDNSKTSSVDASANTAKLVIGKWSESSLSTRFFYGDIDEVHILDGAVLPDEVASLYSFDIIQRGMTQNWYSINDQPHYVETFAGEELDPSAISQDFVDNWGNRIYSKDALGNEVMSSYANTNHQYHFYAPADLKRTSTGKLYDNSFDFARFDWSTVSGFVQYDWDETTGSFAPSMKVTPYTLDDTIEHTFAATYFVNVHMLVKLSTVKETDVLLYSGTTLVGGVQFATSGTLNIKTPTGWSACGGTIKDGEWHKLTISRLPTQYRVFLDDGNYLCSPTQLSSADIDRVRIEFVQTPGGWTAWFDNMRIETGTLGGSVSITINGLAARQMAEVRALDGGLVKEVQSQTGEAVTLDWLKPWGGSTGSGVVRVYAADGLLEYESAQKKIYGGDVFSYTQPKISGDRLVRTRSGFGFFMNPDSDRIDEPGDETGRGPFGTWSWSAAPAVRGTNVLSTPFGFGQRSFGYQGGSGAILQWSDFLVQYVEIPRNQAPEGITLQFYEDSASPGWRGAYWGLTSVPGSLKSQGALPGLRDQWVKLLVQASDLFAAPDENGRKYVLDGGAAYWDYSGIASSEVGMVKLTGLSQLGTGLSVSVRWAGNGTLIQSVSNVAQDSVFVDLYGTKKLTFFPILARIEIASPAGIVSTSPDTTLWGGDIFRYVGSAGFYDAKDNSPPVSSHVLPLGTRASLGDCFDAVLCYDMETLVEGRTVSVSDGSGSVPTLVQDLSGKGNPGTLGSAVTFSSIGDAASGLGLKFDGSTSSRVDTSVGATTKGTLSFWAKPSALPSWEVPIGIKSADGTRYFLVDTYTSASPNWRLVIKTDTTEDAVSSGVVPSTSRLDQVVLTWDQTQPSGQFKLYINGILAATLTATDQPTSLAEKWTIGASNLGSWNPFSGVIDQVLIYDRVLSSGEVAALDHARLPATSSAFAQIGGNGLLTRTKIAFEGRYLYAAAGYDSRGLLVSSTDLGTAVTGGPNVTYYSYSDAYQNAYLTQLQRPDGRSERYSYDQASGLKLGTLTVDCKRVRTEYDSVGRPTRTLVYDSDPSVKLDLDMETPGGFASDLIDVSCNGNTGAIHGPTEANGIQGNARAFAGNGHVDVGPQSSLEPSRITVSAWIYPTSITTSDLVDKSYPDATGSGYVLLINSDGSVQFTIYDGDLTPVSAVSVANAIQANSWYLITGTFDGSNVKVYLNGAERGSTAFTGSISYNDVGRWLIVGANYATTARFFSGTLDEVMVFNRAITSTELLDLAALKFKMLRSNQAAYDDMTGTSVWAGFQATSVTWYDGVSTPRKLLLDMQTVKATVGSTTFLEDLSGNGNNAVVSGAVPMSSGGKIGGYYAFDPSNGLDSIQVSSDENRLDMTDEFTIAGWFQLSDNGNRWGISKWDAVNPSGESYVLIPSYSGTGGKPYFAVSSGSTTDAVDCSPSGCSPLPTGAWRFMAATFSRGTMTEYVDSGSSLSVYSKVSTTVMRIGNSPSKVTIGAASTAWGNFYGGIDEIHILDRALSSAEITALYQMSETGHMTRSYVDGLGRATRTVVQDFFGKTIAARSFLGANDQILQAFPPAATGEAGKVETFTYDSVGRRLSDTAPGDGGLAVTNYFDKDRMVEFVDAVGRKTYQRTDLLGRTIETAVWDPSRQAYGNFTSSTYNAAGKVTRSIDGNQKATVTYYDAAGNPRFVIYPDGTTSAAAYGDNLRPVRTMDQMGRVRTVSYDSLGRVATTGIGQWVQAKYPTANSGTTDNCLGGAGSDSGDWTNPSNAQSVGGGNPDDNVDATASPGKNALYCNEWNTFGFALPSDASILSVRVVSEYYVSTTSSIAHLHVGLQTTNGGTNCVVQEDMSEPTARTTLTFDFTSCKSWSAADFNANALTVEVGAHRGNSNTAVTFDLDYVRVEVQYTSLAWGSGTTSYYTTFQYDSSDNLASVKNGTASIYRQFDALHQITAEFFAMPDTCPTNCASNLSVGYAYDAAGRVTAITYHDGTTKAYYTYDSLSRVASVGFGAANNKQADITYDGASRIDLIHYYEDGTDIGLYEDYSYDLRDRVTQLRVYKGTTDYLKLDYLFDKASEISHIDDNAGSGTKTHDYAYDGNGRISWAAGPWGTNEGPLTLTYRYDAVGNILSKDETVGSTTSTNYEYDSAGWNKLWKTSVNGGTATVYSYNGAGSLTLRDVPSGTDSSYMNDFAQRLVKLTDSGGTHQYDYDGIGRRIKTSEPGSVTRYFVLSGDRTLGYKEGSSNTFFVYLGIKLMLRRTGTSDNRYYFQDVSLNSRLVAYYTTSVQTDFKARYKPFGEVVVLTGTSGTLNFATQKLDSSGLYHMGARNYDPALGRFLSRDPRGSGYGYAFNNPLSFWDPSGLKGNIIEPPTYVFNPSPNLILEWWNGLPRWQQALIIVVVAVAVAATLIPSGGTSAFIGALIVGAIVGGAAMAVGYFAFGHTDPEQLFLDFAIGLDAGVTVYSAAIGFGLVGGGRFGLSSLRSTAEEVIPRASRMAADGGNLDKLRSAAKEAIDDLKGIGKSEHHLARADRLLGTLDHLSDDARDLLKESIDSPGGFQFLARTRGGRVDIGVVGEGNRVIVHLGRERWIGSIKDITSVTDTVKGLQAANFERIGFDQFLQLLVLR